jgi:SagB-type dehydrogenase family enzyme
MTTEVVYGGLPGSQERELWSLREDVSVEAGPDGLIQLRNSWGVITIQRATPVVEDALRRMSLGPVSLRNVTGSGRPEAGPPGERDSMRSLSAVLGRLQALVVRSLALDSGQAMLSVVPLQPRSRFHPVLLKPWMSVRLSRFAQLRTDGSEYRLESPIAQHRVVLHRPEALWLIGSLARGTTVAGCADALPQPSGVLVAALSYLCAAGIVVCADDQVSFAEDDEAALAGWSALDLMFHTRSTIGRHDEDVGATFPKERSREPVVKPPMEGTEIPLHRPSWKQLVTNDPPLTAAIEARSSVRSYAEAPPTAAELGELLYRSARVRSVSGLSAPGHHLVATEPPNGAGAERSDRPYPSGGACHELELYVTVGHCAGLDPGVYHYDPLNHVLELINVDQKISGELLKCASRMANMDSLPPLLITITARIGRLSWKYEGLVYSLVLKHVGVLTQNLYLVCAAMRLGSCALGSANIDLTARAFGIDWRAEPSVGQFIVGGLPTGRPGRNSGGQPANDAWWADAANEWFRRVE